MAAVRRPVIPQIKLSKEGKIPSIRIGRVRRFDKEVIGAWIARGQGGQRKTAKIYYEIRNEDYIDFLDTTSLTDKGLIFRND